MAQISSGQTQDPDPSVYNTEAEQQLLGSLLVNNENYSRVVGVVEAGDFFDPLHQRIFEQIQQRIDAGQLASPITMKPAFENDQGMKELGGPRYLARLAGASISSSAIAEYAAMITDLSAKRNLIQCFDQAKVRIFAGEGAAAIAIDVETSAGGLLNKASTKPLIRSHLNAITASIMQINDAYQGIKPNGVLTGLSRLDSVLGSMRSGELILIGARPSMGKTTLAQNLIFNAAQSGVGVFFPSLEMNAESVGNRFLSLGLSRRNIKIPYNRMLKGDLTESEFRSVVDEAKRQESLPIYLGERDVREVSRLRAAAKRAQQRMADSPCPLGLIVLDYLQLIQSAKARSTYDRVSEASDLCKSLAMEFDLPVVALAQLSRNVEMRDPPVPMLSDLRESGKLEEDADAVLFTYRDAYYLERKLNNMSNEDINKEADIRATLERCRDQMDVIIAKQRSGPLKTVPLFVDLGTSNVYDDRSHVADGLI
ncbi:AAA family ATPase [Sulfitobacter pseudonitzschiae]|uniref:DNA 5'-3' helicase n=1 Tax=Pseudosulfitobacter pseudonitzschiae TaxID=1402135 RepID=A0A9Q2P3N2_9RHOB|nr:DnaB-like helicase C-terminal domain-containing protein [Pseudosulfitobacter pseudonitzschiae]MBM2293804.1 AAA family ATPase [Pseudosulfitobacter pseudonitzschiae]MBM2298721.1 AAA family ATPase [Pseudosulfitobacter pseudonitzschiae]MBM2303636.1 AAA family ATPase [Pseudosulfitobacter pseudonitzschiae]MBM2313418.1 AAA family ATPase [Pseudosulfitobacter pseudonitzschiae]MBM2318332.1 AAA family ATPase [Pseudosulfitobacter pseudonitzschiae]